MRSTRLTVAALALALPLSIAACGSDSEMGAGSTDTMSSSSAPAPSASASESMGTEMAGAPFGPGCAMWQAEHWPLPSKSSRPRRSSPVSFALPCR